MSKHHIVQAKYMQFTLHQLYFNKTESKQKRTCVLPSTHTTLKMPCLHFKLSRTVFSWPVLSQLEPIPCLLLLHLSSRATSTPKSA